MWQEQSCWLPLSGFDSETAQNIYNCHRASFAALNLGFFWPCLLSSWDFQSRPVMPH